MIMLGTNPYRALEILPYGTPLGVLGGERLRFIAFFGRDGILEGLLPCL